MQRLAEIGVLGMAVPQEYGGSGLGILGSEIRIRGHQRTWCLTCLSCLTWRASPVPLTHARVEQKLVGKEFSAPPRSFKPLVYLCRIEQERKTGALPIFISSRSSAPPNAGGKYDPTAIGSLTASARFHDGKAGLLSLYLGL